MLAYIGKKTGFNSATMFSQVTEDERQDFRQKLAAREAEFTRKADELRRQQNELAKAREGSKSRSSSASMLSSKLPLLKLRRLANRWRPIWPP
jgi:predicted nuclease with TOPRIM domain